MPALNPPGGTNNLLALALREAVFGRGDAGYCDTGEPVATGVTVTTTGAVVQVNFTPNAMGAQPAVSCGAIAVLVIGGTGMTVGPITISAVDTTATSGGHAEIVGIMQAGSSGSGMCICAGWASSLAAGTDAANGPLTNVVGLRANVGLAGAGTVFIKMVGVGTT